MQGIWTVCKSNFQLKFESVPLFFFSRSSLFIAFGPLQSATWHRSYANSARFGSIAVTTLRLCDTQRHHRRNVLEHTHIFIKFWAKELAMCILATSLKRRRIEEKLKKRNFAYIFSIYTRIYVSFSLVAFFPPSCSFYFDGLDDEKIHFTHIICISISHRCFFIQHNREQEK